tara:strand:+ start:449 stop:1147 length:699 start_codon:yes stop_codon:yes gene_type:complete
MILTVIIPAYNEKNTIKKIIQKIKLVKNIKKQIILVDDGSTDGTTDIIKKKLSSKVDKIIFHKRNFGKGAAIISAKKFIKGNYVIIQDADLEYNPQDYQKILKLMIYKKKLAVYGSRVLGKKRYSVKNFTSKSRVFFNHILTIFSNILFNQNLSDAHTCYKAFDANFFKKIKLIEKDFAFCPEITAKISKLGIKIHEIPIDYSGRSYEEGKKISIYDGFRAIYVLIKYKFIT